MKQKYRYTSNVKHNIILIAYIEQICVMKLDKQDITCFAIKSVNKHQMV